MRIRFGSWWRRWTAIGAPDQFEQGAGHAGPRSPPRSSRAGRSRPGDAGSSGGTPGAGRQDRDPGGDEADLHQIAEEEGQEAEGDDAAGRHELRQPGEAETVDHREAGPAWREPARRGRDRPRGRRSARPRRGSPRGSRRSARPCRRADAALRRAGKDGQARRPRRQVAEHRRDGETGAEPHGESHDGEGVQRHRHRPRTGSAPWPRA